MRFIAAAALAAVLVAPRPEPVLAGSSNDGSAMRKSVDLSFGVYQSDKATVMYRQFSPVIEAIQGAMEKRLSCPVDIQLRIFKSYDEAIEAVVRGEVDFVRFGPASYVIAKQNEPEIELLAIETENGKRRFEGVFIVAASSPIQKLADLKGKKFAFGDRNSTIGRYLSQAELVSAGVTAKDLAGYDYLERHDRVAKAVAVGDFDAGAVKIETFEKEKAGGKLRAIGQFENVTKPWFARAGLDADVVKSIREALFALKDPAVLKEIGATGFEPVEDSEYAFVREGMQRALHFDK